MAENHDEHADSSQQWEDQTVYGPSTVIAALDRIEDLLEAARAVPLSASVMVNRAEVLDLLDQAREALPDDLKAADAVVADADAVLVRADSAAETTIAEANARARSTIAEAREKADQLVAEAEEHAQKTRSVCVSRPRRMRRTPLPTPMRRQSALYPERTSSRWLKSVRVRLLRRRVRLRSRCVPVPMNTLPRHLQNYLHFFKNFNAVPMLVGVPLPNAMAAILRM